MSILIKYRKWITNNPWSAIFAVAIAGLALRLISIGEKSLWLDESYVTGLIHLNPVELIKQSISGSPHPPLAFLLIKLSTTLFGHAESGLRMLSAVASAFASVPLMYLLKRKINLTSALWVGIIWSVSPYAVSLGQEAYLFAAVSFLGFLFIDIADRAWNGSSIALYLLVPVALAGMLMDYMFGFFLLAGTGLYFAIPREHRISYRKYLMVFGIFAVLYAPFFLLFLKQAAFRSERISRAGLDMIAVYKYRSMVLCPTVFARLIPGGLLLEAGKHLIHDSKQIVFWLVFGGGNLFLMLNLFLRKMLEKKFRIWLLLVLLIPFLTYLRDDPTVRHLVILWIPLSFAIASVSNRWKYAGPVMFAVTAIMLLPYYNIGSFPYHRSDWRASVEYVEEHYSGDEGILVLGGPLGGLIWDYYSFNDFPRTALGGETPYVKQMVAGRTMDSAIDSLLNLHNSIWIVCDNWGTIITAERIPDYRIMSESWLSPTMQIVHISK